MTDREELGDRLDAVEEVLADTPPREWGPTIVYTTEDGYETGDGDPVPTDADGRPDPPTARDDAPIIIYDGLYEPATGDARGDT